MMKRNLIYFEIYSRLQGESMKCEFKFSLQIKLVLSHLYI